VIESVYHSQLLEGDFERGMNDILLYVSDAEVAPEYEGDPGNDLSSLN
jgi:hypothetical protein